jgi:COP9 signalosome complex subunit 2
MRPVQHLNIPRAEVEELLMALILDGRVSGRIDGVRAQLTLLPRTGAGAGADAGKTLSARRYAALTRWTNQVQRLGDMLEEKQAAGVGGGGVVGAAALGMGGGMGGRGGPVQRVR